MNVECLGFVGILFVEVGKCLNGLESFLNSDVLIGVSVFKIKRCLRGVVGKIDKYFWFIVIWLIE